MLKKRIRELESYMNAFIQSSESNGIRIGHQISINKFREGWHGSYPLPGKDEELFCLLQEPGILLRGVIYLPDSMVDLETKKEVLKQLEEWLGYNNAVQISALFQNKKEVLKMSLIQDEETFLLWIKKILPTEYHVKNGFIIDQEDACTDANEILKEYLKWNEYEVNLETIKEDNPFLDQIENSLRKIDGVLKTKDNNWYLIDNLHLSNNEIESVSKSLYLTTENGALTNAQEIFQKFKTLEPGFFQRNPFVGDEIILYFAKKSNLYNVNGISIVRNNGEKDLKNLFLNELEKQKITDFNLALELATQMGKRYVYSTLLTRYIRTDQNNLVSKDEIRFDSYEIDKQLYELMEDKPYILERDIGSFYEFPDCGVRWNKWVLESYIDSCDTSFRVIRHSNLNGRDLYNSGVALVPKNGSINDFDDLLEEIIYNTGIEFTKDQALNFLKEEGLIKKARHNSISLILERCKLRRRESINV